MQTRRSQGKQDAGREVAYWRAILTTPSDLPCTTWPPGGWFGGWHLVLWGWSQVAGGSGGYGVDMVTKHRAP